MVAESRQSMIGERVGIWAIVKGVHLGKPLAVPALN
jgi:hypothetical protein